MINLLLLAKILARQTFWPADRSGEASKTDTSSENSAGPAERSLMKYPQYVYVLLAERSGMLKVGYAADPGRRLAELQTGSPEELILMGYLPGGPELEQHIHNLLRVEHVHGEWFRATDDVLATLRTLLATQGTLRSVQDELERRHNALHGLRGLRVYLKGQGTTLWTILDSRWG